MVFRKERPSKVPQKKAALPKKDSSQNDKRERPLVKKIHRVIPRLRF